MEERKAWIRDELHNGITIFQSIETAAGSLLAAYLGPGGAFIHMLCCDDALQACVLLKDTLQTTHLQLYTEDQGLYDSASGTFTDPIPPEDVQELALSFVDGSESWLGYSHEDLKRMEERLIFADAYVRGWYRSQEGREYILRRNGFQEVSDIDPDVLYYLALFGGAFGIHRFYMGKNLTGFLYFLTGGLLMTGWAIDLLFLLLGIQRDKHKRLVYPPSQRLLKFLLIPVGGFLSVLILTAVHAMVRWLIQYWIS